MKPKDKKIIGGGGEGISYSSNVWLCRCKKCDMSFFSKQTRIVCESCENMEKRDEKLDDLLNNNIKS
jgi:Zn finger protein HypA/HybF involved in hydrogenase expression